MKIILIILIIGLLISINGCILTEQQEEKSDDTSELSEMDQDLNPNNLGDIDKEIDETINW